MKAKTTFPFLATCLCIANSLFAQQSVFKGQIIDANDENPVAFANVLLLTPDSTFITGTTSDLDGYFELKDASQENYLLSVSFIGYDTAWKPVTSGDDENSTKIKLRQSSISLNEVTIQASSVIQKEDRKVIFPTQMQIETASDGTDIIRKMQLPRIMVDPTSGEISMSGNGEVQLRINGVQVTHAEIASIPPADILRIEYHDDPGARYGTADAVINYITRKKESGGNINGIIYHGFGKNRSSADDRISLKYNHAKSEFSANASFTKREQDWTREYDEKLIFPDYELHRLEVGEPTPFNKNVLTSNLNYSLIEDNNYFFNAQLRFTRNDFPNSFEDRRSKLYTSDSEIPLSIFDHTVEKSGSPALDLYYQYYLKDNQQLIFNIVGTYINTDSRRVYQEKRDNVFETDLLSNVSGDKYSLIAEGIYEKKIEQGLFTGGIKHLQSHADNKYSGTITANVSMRQAESFIYAEYQGRIGKWGYMANMTGARLYYSQKDNHIEKFTLQPSARITFEPNRNLYFRYRINLRTNAPSLAAINDIEQAIDSWQIRRGNPNLSAFQTLSQSFATTFNKGFFGIDLLIGYDHEYNPIMESVFYEEGKFIRTYENQKSFQNLNGEVTFKLKPWANHLSLSVTPRINRFISQGNNYKHTYTMSELRINLDFSYNNWLANFTTITPPRFMYGEQMTKSDQMYTIMAGYKQSNWSLMVGALNLFTNEYRTDNRDWSTLNPVSSKIHTNNNRSFLAKLSFNLNYGKQFKGVHKIINNTDVDSGIMQGIKN
ncbi:carboxypeptidase-like regulatory domain-containing protein [Parabacteroides sp. OttesenSCG-928-G07]|nr:carboxypeptidase-like regulatory domain-containing protein [Parabacteroides sp. OttesenSCG-928-G07]